MKARAALAGSFVLLLALIHLPYLDLPYFWDELGYYVPAALDLYRQGAWIPVSTTPNIHPPGLSAWLSGVWLITGHSIPATRLAMILLAGLGAYVSFLLAIRLSRGAAGAPAFAAVLFLIATPLFYTQSMMAQIDMPAMGLATLALLLFFEGRIRAAALVSTALVLVRETGIVLPAMFALWLWFADRRRRDALWFLIPAAALGLWIFLLWKATGHAAGDPRFAEYNAVYSLHPVRLGFAILRRINYLFLADFRWIGTIAIALGWRVFATREWKIAGLTSAAYVLLVTVFGGANLERYLIPVFPVLCAAMAAGASVFSKRVRILANGSLILGLAISHFWHPPYPFPFENNLAMTDFVDLHRSAASFLENKMPGQTVATAWPLSDALRYPDFGYVSRGRYVIETNGFERSRVAVLDVSKFDALVIYSRNMEEKLLENTVIARFLNRWWNYEPQVTTDYIRQSLGFDTVIRWTRGGQWIEIYIKHPRE